jgi:hypothetical protein
MMCGVLPKTCWAIKKHWNNKFYYTVASFWFFLCDLYYDARIHERQVYLISLTDVKPRISVNVYRRLKETSNFQVTHLRLNLWNLSIHVFSNSQGPKFKKTISFIISHLWERKT